MRLVRRFSAVFAAVAALAVSAAFSLSCGGSGNATEKSSTTTPSPSPTASASGVMWSSTCTLGPGDPDAAECLKDGPSRLWGDVSQAMDRLVAARPELFDLMDDRGSGAYKVLDRTEYMKGLVAELIAGDLCAEFDAYDPDQEVIFVKSSNDFSEEYDVLYSTGHIRRGENSMRATCTPAFFPYPLTDDIPPPGSGCYRPFPPEIHHMQGSKHTASGNRVELDVTPYVLGPGSGGYCDAIGYPGADTCVVRRPGVNDRLACENWRVGKAEDNGREGPTWTKEDGSYCTGPESGCQNTEDNQYQLWVWEDGRYKVCAQTGKCDWVSVP